MQVDQGKVRIVVLGRRHGIVRVVRDGDDPVSRIVLDQIFQRGRKLRIVLDNQDLKHRIPPHPLEKSTVWMKRSKRGFANPP